MVEYPYCLVWQALERGGSWAPQKRCSRVTDEIVLAKQLLGVKFGWWLRTLATNKSLTGGYTKKQNSETAKDY